MENTVLILTNPEPEITSHQRPGDPNLKQKSQQQLGFPATCMKQHSRPAQTHTPRLTDEQAGLPCANASVGITVHTGSTIHRHQDSEISPFKGESERLLIVRGG